VLTPRTENRKNNPMLRKRQVPGSSRASRPLQGLVRCIGRSEGRLRYERQRVGLFATNLAAMARVSCAGAGGLHTPARGDLYQVVTACRAEE
jgi:hypothetical protein